MSRQLHFGTTYQVQYGYGGMFGSDGQDALYDIFSMFEIENNAEVHEAIARLEGIDCRGKGTSCPDQLAQALKRIAD